MIGKEGFEFELGIGGTVVVVVAGVDVGVDVGTVALGDGSDNKEGNN